MLARPHRGAKVLGICVLLRASTAAAEPSAEECEAAYVRTQQSRMLEKRYVAANESARVCAQASCPAFVRQECTTWLAELAAITPTFIAAAVDGEHDVSDAVLEIDGRIVASRLDGTARPIDPGEHRLSIQRQGRPTLTRTLVFREGEQGRRVEFRWGVAPPPPPPPTDPSPWPYVVGATGIAATVTWVTLAAIAYVETTNLRDTCGQTRSCAQDDVDAAHAKAIAADVSLAVAGTSFAVAAILFVTLPTRSDAPVTAGLVPSVGPGFAGGSVIGSF